MYRSDEAWLVSMRQTPARAGPGRNAVSLWTVQAH